MGKFYVDVDQATNQVTYLRSHKSALTAKRTSLMEVHNNLWIGVESEAIKEVIERLDRNIQLEANDIEVLAQTLELAIKLYVGAENQILQKIQPTAIEAPSGQFVPAPSEENPDEKNEDPDCLDKWILENTNLTKEELEILKLILGFIPVINCLVDLYDLINDFQKAKNDDGEISVTEWIGLGMDALFLVMDAVSAVQFIGKIADAVKTAKKASTTAKTASEAAEVAAKKAMKKETAEKAATETAEKAAKNADATKVARDATKAKYPKNSKYVQDAEKGYKNATKEAKNAKDAAKTAADKAKDAKNIEKNAVEKAKEAKEAADKAKKAVKDTVVDEVKGNVKQRYNGKEIDKDAKGLKKAISYYERVPGKIPSTAKDWLIDEDVSLDMPIGLL